MKKIVSAFVILAAVFALAVPTVTLVPASASAQALTLDQAKAQGLVGEKLDGYLGVVSNAAGVSRLVDDINLQRRQLYRDIARKNNIPLNAVEQLAGKKAIERAASGEYVQSPSGAWARK